MTNDEFRVEVTIRVVPRETTRKVGHAKGDEVFSYEADKGQRLYFVLEMCRKAFEQALKESET